MDMLKRSKFDKLIERATNEVLLEPDIETTLTICDLIRGQEISSKLAVSSVKKRLQNDNPNVVLHTLFVLESMMKNCGTPIHEEVVTADFLTSFSSLITVSYDVRVAVLSCIQNWAFVFKDKAEYSAVQEIYDTLKENGEEFPAFSENDAMFSVVCAPNWKEENSCHRCKVAFTTFRRRHHCRNCGNSFCADCSSEKAMLPQFGIEKEVRVCDHCYEQLTNPSAQSKPKNDPKPTHQQTDKDAEKTRREREMKERELENREKEELELALALSASEAECKDRQRQITKQPSQPLPSSTTYLSNSQNGPLQVLPVLDTSDMDPELARYLNRHYWDNRAVSLNAQQQQQSTGAEQSYALPERATLQAQPSAPIYASPEVSKAPITTVSDGLVRSGNDKNVTFPVKKNNAPALEIPGIPELTTPKQDEFLQALRASIEFFVNRMQSNNQRGRSIANDTTVQALFLTLHEMHPQLLQQKQAMEDRRAYFEGMQDKLTQLREAREALDSLRQEHAVRRQMEEQEAARLRQMQMMQKLEVMRQQKRDTMEYRRRMAMEQTMQYQHQYSTAANPSMPPIRMLDPSTGLPISMSNYPTVYPSTTIGGGLGAAPGATQITYPPANYPPPPAAGTEASVMGPSYYHYQQQQQPQQYPPAMYTYGQPQQMPPTQAAAIPSSTYTHSNYNSAYSMQQMESSLPQQMENTAMYHPYIGGTDHQGPYPTSGVPVQPDDPNQHGVPQVQEKPPDTNYSASPASVPQGPQQQQQQAQSLEGQLISFD